MYRSWSWPLHIHVSPWSGIALQGIDLLCFWVVLSHPGSCWGSQIPHPEVCYFLWAQTWCEKPESPWVKAVLDPRVGVMETMWKLCFLSKRDWDCCRDEDQGAWHMEVGPSLTEYWEGSFIFSSVAYAWSSKKYLFYWEMFWLRLPEEWSLEWWSWVYVRRPINWVPHSLNIQLC